VILLEHEELFKLCYIHGLLKGIKETLKTKIMADKDTFIKGLDKCERLLNDLTCIDKNND